jgi:GR25 family glycosyltransferase involved in LPS biosynthesis
MLSYLISSINETDRLENINELKYNLPSIITVEAIYPSITRVPFLEKIRYLAKKRTGRLLSNAELGLLLSHRNAWNLLLSNNNYNEALILESDSNIINLEILHNNFNKVHENYDVFFWGAYDGRMKIYEKSKIVINENFYIGTPVINSVYCTYGYSINKKAASYLLKQSSQVNFPVDYWKIRLKNSNLKVGGIISQVIVTNPQFKSTVQKRMFNIYNTTIVKKIIDFKNILIAKISV